MGPCGADEFYDIVPVGGPRVVDDLRYGAQAQTSGPPSPAEYAFVKIRDKLPRSDRSVLISTPVDRASEHGRFEDAPSMPALQPVWPRSARFSGAESTPASSAMTTCCVSRRPRAATILTAIAPSFLQLVRAAKTASAMQPLRP
jgi:Ca-activated chloride channel homolog